MSLYQVDIIGSVNERVQVIRALRTIGRLSLKKADAICNYLNGRVTTTVVAGVNKEVADKITETLRTAGLNATIQTSSVSAPMVLDDSVRNIFVWTGSGALATLRKL